MEQDQDGHDVMREMTDVKRDKETRHSGSRCSAETSFSMPRARINPAKDVQKTEPEKAQNKELETANKSVDKGADLGAGF